MTMNTITHQAMAEYRNAAKKRWATEQRDLAQREARAWELARQAAALLKKRFGATRVVVFGSLVHTGCFTPWSDVDIAAWGVSPNDTFRAIGAALDLNAEIKANLVDVAACSTSLLKVIEQEGIAL